jgi:hypothetical protein
MTSITNPLISPAAERMRRYRERKRAGRRCIIVEIFESDIDALVRKGWLGHETRNDPIEIVNAIYKLLDILT